MNNNEANKLETAMIFFTIATSLLGAYTAYLKLKQMKLIKEGE